MKKIVMKIVLIIITLIIQMCTIALIVTSVQLIIFYSFQEKGNVLTNVKKIILINMNIIKNVIIEKSSKQLK